MNIPSKFHIFLRLAKTFEFKMISNTRQNTSEQREQERVHFPNETRTTWWQSWLSIYTRNINNTFDNIYIRVHVQRSIQQRNSMDWKLQLPGRSLSLSIRFFFQCPFFFFNKLYNTLYLRNLIIHGTMQVYDDEETSPENSRVQLYKS